MASMCKFNYNFYDTDSIEVIEIRAQGQFDLYDVLIHMKSGKTFFVYRNKTLEEALNKRTIMTDLIGGVIDGES